MIKCFFNARALEFGLKKFYFALAILLLYPVSFAWTQDLTRLFSRDSIEQIRAYYEKNPEAAKNINQPFGSRNDTPLSAAARRNSPEVLDYLIKLGAAPCYVKKGAGQTALMAAARENNNHLAVGLLAGASQKAGCLDATDSNRYTALMHAAEKTGNPDVVRVFIASNADPHLESRNHANAADLIKKNSNFSPLDNIVQELEEYQVTYVPSPVVAETAALPEEVTTSPPLETETVNSAGDKADKVEAETAPPLSVKMIASENNDKKEHDLDTLKPAAVEESNIDKKLPGDSAEQAITGASSAKAPGKIKFELDADAMANGVVINVASGATSQTTGKPAETQFFAAIITFIAGFALLGIGAMVLYKACTVEKIPANKRKIQLSAIAGIFLVIISLLVIFISPHSDYVFNKIIKLGTTIALLWSLVLEKTRKSLLELLNAFSNG